MNKTELKKFIIDFIVSDKKVTKTVIAPTQEQALKKKAFTANDLLAIGEEVEIREAK